MNRRAFLTGMLTAPLAARPARADMPSAMVAKSPTCGCCGAWIDHLRSAGFDPEVRDMSPAALDAFKARLGIRPEHASCHTAVIDGYFIEGHVPADDVKRLLEERPAAAGLAVPGMPIGSPGMEMGAEKEPFDTLLVSASGKGRIFASHR